MIFAVDIGNSNIVAALLDDKKEVQRLGRIASDRQKTKGELVTELKTLLCLDEMSISEIEGGIISSVVPELTGVVEEAILFLTGKQPIIVSHTMNTGIEIATDYPNKVGCDLIVDAVAAVAEHTGTLVIFDAGTATTCSVVDEKHTYLGTIIVPGIKVAEDALIEKTSQLPEISYETPRNLIGKNTVESMQSGLVYGNAAMIDGLIERIEQELQQPVTVIATGGIAGVVVPHCRHEIVYDADLLLKGLWYLFYKNQ
jgi:type III pantothenate kinase